MKTQLPKKRLMIISPFKTKNPKVCLSTTKRIWNNIKLSVVVFGFSVNLSAQTIAGGGYHSLTICNDKSVMAFGTTLGNGTDLGSNIPVQVSSLTNITAVTGGGLHSLALKNDSTVWGWGSGDEGQIGNGTNTGSNIPVQISALTNVTAIAAGTVHSLALKNYSTVWAWGRGADGQLGNGDSTNSNIPVEISSLTGIVAIWAGLYHSLALKGDGTVWAWGNNFWGQLGNGTITDSYIPIQISSLTGIVAISSGANHSLALKNDGTVWAWGQGDEGQTGNGTNTGSNIPVQVGAPSNITAITGGSYHSLALRSDSTVWAWGRGTDGQLGIGTNIDSNIPIQVSALTAITAIAGGGFHSIAQKNDGTVLSWGDNFYGQLGDGTNISSNLPIQTTGLCGPVLVWPGDADEDLIANNSDVLAIGLGYGFTGPVRAGANNTWIGQYADDWAQSLPNGTNCKFTDCNGDGIIDDNDTLAVSLNYGYNHPYRSIEEVTTGSANISLVANTHTIGLNTPIIVDIMLGNSTTPIDSIYGLAFTINFDDITLVDSNTISLSSVNSWFGTPGTNVLTFSRKFPTAASINIAITGIDHLNRMGQGKIGELGFVTPDNLSGITDATVHLTISDITAITLSQQPITLNPMGDTVHVSAITSIKNIDLAKTIIYPNPATDEITVKVANQKIDKLTIYAPLGQIVKEIDFASTSTAQINLSSLPKGVYFMAIQTNEGAVINKKIQKY